MDKAFKVGFGPMMIAGVTFVISIISMSLAEIMTTNTPLGISLTQLASSANFISLSALSAAIIVSSVAFVNTPGTTQRIIFWLILAFLLFFILGTISINQYQEVGINTGKGIFFQQIARILNFFSLAALIAAIGIPSMDLFKNRFEIKIKT